MKIIIVVIFCLDEVATEVGFKIQIHDQREPPLITEMGFGVSPGFQTLVTAKEQRLSFLPEPWGKCMPVDEPIGRVLQNKTSNKKIMQQVLKTFWLDC